jgi:hypothetical protein
MRMTIALAISLGAGVTATAAAPARAGTLAGSAVTVQPGGEDGLGGGGLELWLAHAWDGYYAGGELAAESYTSGESDFALSYHALLGARHPLGERVAIVADVGAGISQQIDVRLGLLGSESDTDTEAVVPSGAVRASLVVALGTIGESRIGLAFAGDLRGTTDGDAGGGVGLGVVTWK